MSKELGAFVSGTLMVLALSVFAAGSATAQQIFEPPACDIMPRPVGCNPCNALPYPAGCSDTKFCGNVKLSTQGMTNHGVEVDEPYIGHIELLQRSPDEGDEFSIDTEWDCTQPLFECGWMGVQMSDFTAPGNPEPGEVFGPVAGINQTTSTYRANADLDDFVVGPATLGATGFTTLEILCVECDEVNTQTSIKPDFKDLIGNISGEVIIEVTIPGIGGSLAPPGGNPQDVRLSLTRLGGACNNILPATSSWGLVALVGLMVVTSVFFAGRGARAKA